MIEFRGCASPTVGVEWELQLLDAETLDLADGIVPLMEFFPNARYVKPEFIQSSVELNSRVCADSLAARDHLAELLAAVLARSDELDFDVCGAGTHPFCRRLALITPLPRYQRIEKNSGYLGHTQITFATHVHVGMPSGDIAMRVMRHLAPCLPVFIALAANSPFWRGHQTGHACYRQRILAAAPNYGLPTMFEDWAAFDRFFRTARRAQIFRTLKDIHWDIRPHPDYGTLEIRAMDAASDLDTVQAIAGFARTLMVLIERGSAKELMAALPRQLPPWLERENHYRAARLGLEAEIVVDAAGGLRSVGAITQELLQNCRDVAMDIGEVAALAGIGSMIVGSGGYLEQRRVYAASHSARAVTEYLRNRLRRGVRPRPTLPRGAAVGAS